MLRHNHSGLKTKCLLQKQVKTLRHGNILRLEDDMVSAALRAAHFGAETDNRCQLRHNTMQFVSRQMNQFLLHI